MSNKNVKNLLKDAREAIKNRNFNETIIKCKDVLEMDKKNYMAYVLLGAAYQESDKHLAVTHLKEAINCNPNEPTVALQGLLNCVTNDEIPDIIRKLLKLTPDKFLDLHQKLFNVTSENSTNADQSINIFLDESNIKDATERRQSALSNLAQIFILLKDIDEKYFSLMCLSYEAVLPDITIKNNLKIWKNYLKLLYDLNQFDKLVEQSCNMSGFYPNEQSPYEWICKIFIEHFDNDCFDINKYLSQPVHTYIDILSSMESNNITGLIAKAIHLYTEEDYLNSRHILEQVYTVQSKNCSNVCLKILAEINVKFNAFEKGEFYYRKLNDLTNIKFLDCLVHQFENRQKLDETIKICKSILPNAKAIDQPKLVNILTRALIYKHQFDVADKTIDKLKNMDEIEQSNILLALKYTIQEQYQEAIDTLTNNEYNLNCNYYLQLGQNHFLLNQYQEAYEIFLIAIKLKSYNSDCFYWLGKIYSVNENYERAIKCLDKSIQLNSLNKNAVILLSTIYRKLSKLDDNQMLLETTVQELSMTNTTVDDNKEHNWALIQLGFHYLAKGSYESAIQSFRKTLQYDSEDIRCWEGLADSYLQRGSYNSALKVYQKINAIDPTNIYIKYQIGNIKCILHFYRESIVCFEELLSEQPTYIAALKSITEAHLGLANQYLVQRLLGRYKDHIENAVDYVLRALRIKFDFACLWRLLAIALQNIGCMPKSKAFIKLPGELIDSKEEFCILNGSEIFDLSAKCFRRAIKINPNDSLLWYELALHQYLRAIKLETDLNIRKQNLENALEIIKYTITLASTRWQNWNLLGMIYCTNEIKNYKLGMHSFIRAISLDKKSAISWSNLGTLYLTHGNIKLANKAFSRAQQADTSLINGWNGQAVIAEKIDENLEAMDLFRHCISLGYTAESAIGYSHWVCKVLDDDNLMKDGRYQYAIKNLHAIPLSIDAITWYCNAEDYRSTVESLNFYGYLCYQQELWSMAIRAFIQASKLSSGIERDKLYCNLGNAYLKNHQSLEAIKAFSSVSEATFQSTIGLALSYFKASKFEDSYGVYESALEWLTTTDYDKAMVLIAMSAMVYVFHGDKDAKTLLFQCIGQSEPPIESLFSSCALGLIHEDMQLSELVLQELIKHESDPKYSHHVVFLTSQFYLLNNGVRKGLTYILTQVHKYPDRPLLRRVLANYLLNNYNDSDKYKVAASRITESTIVLNRNILLNNKKYSSMEAAKSLAIASETMKFINSKASKLYAQKAVFTNPTCRQAWMVFNICCK